jgi:hypothetical protein
MIEDLLKRPPLRRLLFILCNIAAALFVVFVCILPFKELLASRDGEIREQRETLARLKAIAAREADIQSTAKEATSGAGEFVTGKNDGIISADLQTRLKGMVEAAGAKLRSVRSLQPRTEGQTRYIGSHIEIFGPIAAIHRAIHTIEGAKPYLFVTAGMIKLAPPMGQIGTAQAPLVEAQLDVFGAMRIEARE